MQTLRGEEKERQLMLYNMVRKILIAFISNFNMSGPVFQRQLYSRPEHFDREIKIFLTNCMAFDHVIVEVRFCYLNALNCFHLFVSDIYG